MSEQLPSNDESVSNVKLPIKRVTGDTVSENLTRNAEKNILPARYLRKNPDGELQEDASGLFKRVARNVALGDVPYLAENAGIDLQATPEQIKPKASTSRREDLCEEHFGEDVNLDDDVSIPVTEDNVYAFAFATIVPELPDDLQLDVEETAAEFQEKMIKLSFMPNSPTLMNAGDELQQLSACFVDSPVDDIDNIHDTAREAAKIFQSGGGMGYSFSQLRPYGDTVGSTGGIASGPITFMRTYDQMCETIAQGGKRRGAQMGVMRVDHPDIIQFIHAKDKDVSLAQSLRLNDPDDFRHNSFGDALNEARELIQTNDKGIEVVPDHLRNAAEGHLSNFNISVGATDDFMEAVQNDENYTLTNPRTGEPHIATEETKEMYGWFNLEDKVEVGEPLELPAQEIWERMVEGAWTNGEPGVIYLDRANKDHSFDVDEHPEHEILATNPCGEQPLEEYEACNLGHINLSTVVSEDSPDWREYSSGNDTLEESVEEFLSESVDFDRLNEIIETGTHFLENVVTMSDFPVDKITEKVANNRKVGLGIMGLAQMYIQMGVQYGSEEGDEIAEQVMEHINHKSKEVSRNLAQGNDGHTERGNFPNWDKSKYANPTEYPDWFERMTGEDASDWEDGFPVRNHNTTTIAPTGTTSMLGNTTGGCEPIYNVAYYKNVSGDVQGDEMLVEFDDYFLRTLKENDIDVEPVKKEAEEQMNANEFDGVSGLSTVPDAIGELFIVTEQIDAKAHASIQCALQGGVDSAISKTVNAPEDASVGDASDAFMFVYENGGKGVTYYRDGTRSKQVLTTSQENQEDDFDDETAVESVREMVESGEVTPEELGIETETSTTAEQTSVTPGSASPRDRPKNLSGETTEINTGYGDLLVTINESDGEPFEVIANIGKSGGYTESFTEATARLISLALRSGVSVDEVINQIDDIRSPKVAFDNGERVHSVPDGMGLALDRYNAGGRTPNQPDTQQRTSDSSDADENQVISAGENPECPECESMTLYYSEGCKTCESCGWSEC